MALALRSLPSARVTSAKIFGHIIDNVPTRHSGLKFLRRLQRTTALLRWYQQDLDSMKFPGWTTDLQERKKIRMQSRMERGKSGRPKKGQGKLAQRREKEEKRLAQKAAKAAGKKKAEAA
jgi:hypothetical protein